ncbi:AMP-binding protein [Nonomuraea sp. NPDC050556]|uniref:AMP-binding protein n=1 Tax=Nonomuraea sp. NPDC050556 TaxID=3364369 RepID=UPI003790E994
MDASPWPLLDIAAERGDAVAFYDPSTGSQISYGELVALTRDAGAGLCRRGVLPGDVIGVCADDVVSCVVLSGAVWTAGGVVAPIPSQAERDSVVRWLVGKDIRLLLTDEGCVTTAATAAEISRVREVVVLGAAIPGTTPFALVEASGKGLAFGIRNTLEERTALLPFLGKPMSCSELAKYVLTMPSDEPLVRALGTLLHGRTVTSPIPVALRPVMPAEGEL